MESGPQMRGDFSEYACRKSINALYIIFLFFGLSHRQMHTAPGADIRFHLLKIKSFLFIAPGLVFNGISDVLELMGKKDRVYRIYHLLHGRTVTQSPQLAWCL